MLRRALFAWSCLALLACLPAGEALAQDEGLQTPTYPLLRRTLAARSGDLHTSVAYDSQYVGHSPTDHTAGGSNPWNLYVGTLRPGPNPPNNAVWDFDNQAGLGAGD